MNSFLQHRWLLFITISFFTNLTFGNDPSDVVVVANSNSAESLKVANHYLKSRCVPEQNLIALNLPPDETIDRNTFTERIWNPLLRTLHAKKLIDGTLSKTKDRSGRLLITTHSLNFKYLLLCRDVPLKISNHQTTQSTPFNTLPHKFRTHQASVDSELALLIQSQTKLISWIINPLHKVTKPSSLDDTQALSVCRIDGPTIDDCIDLINQTLIAEKSPLIAGRAYIDLFPGDPDGNRWLNAASKLLKNFGYEVDIEPSELHWNSYQRYDAPAIYLGWYQWHADAPIFNAETNIPPGAIAAHIHSFSAGSIRTNTSHWVGPLIGKGFCVSFGNVFEPYLQLTLRPDLFIEHLLNGATVGEASLYAQPVLSWQNVTIGDPLYTPFPKNKQTDYLLQRHKEKSIDPYEALILVKRSILAEESLTGDLAIQSFIENPSLPLASKLIKDLRNSIHPNVLNSVVDYVVNSHPKTDSDIPILRDISSMIEENRPESAKKIGEHINSYHLFKRTSGEGD
ncbi:MAG: TIGR03790 family protein [Opitutales bacterium]|nr:TIGR03790 family protein [Opitutales bacterium]